MTSSLPLDRVIASYAWNEHKVCINPSLYFFHQGKKDHAKIFVAAYTNPDTGDVRWYASSNVEYGTGGGSALPSCNTQFRERPGHETMPAAALAEITALLEREVGSWCCHLSPTAIELLTLEQHRLSGRIGVQGSLF
jgi:hypothetical protein